MSVLIVDTSSWIPYFKGVPIPQIDQALEDGRAYLPPIVAAELASGVPAGKREGLLDFLRELPLVETDLEHWFRVGELRQKAARKGLTISTPDAHVAQCCLDIGGKLLSEDKVFHKLQSIGYPGLLHTP